MRRHRRGGHQLGGCCCIAGENWWHLNWGGICAVGEKGIRYLGGRIHETWILIGCGKECDPGQLCWEVGQSIDRRAAGGQRRDTPSGKSPRGGFGGGRGDEGWVCQ